MKKVIWLGSAAIIFLILAIITSTYSLNIAKDAIESIGTVSLSQESQDQIDLATEKYTNLSSGYGASILFKDKVNEYVNYDRLANAQSQYISLLVGETIKIYKDSPEDYLQEDIAEDLQEVREIIDAYYPDENFENIDQYNDFVKLEKLYSLPSES